MECLYLLLIIVKSESAVAVLPLSTTCDIRVPKTSQKYRQWPAVSALPKLNSKIHKNVSGLFPVI